MSGIIVVLLFYAVSIAVLFLIGYFVIKHAVKAGVKAACEELRDEGASLR